MSTPAPVADERAAGSAAPLVLSPAPAERARRSVSARVALAGIFLVAAAYHLAWGLGHATPAVFTDELLHSKLAQAFAAGHPFEIRGAHVFFPAFLPALVQAPAWLFGDAGTGYAVAKALNALVMSAAVFPAYWLARQVTRQSYALFAAAAAVAAPALVYHSYLLSEALAYPVFLVTFAVLVRALARPSWRIGVLAVALSSVAVATRVQFVALPLVFAILLVSRPNELRRHAVPAVGLGLLTVAALVGGTALLGTYAGVGLLHFAPGEVARWAAWTGVLVPFAAGWVFVPGAILGLGAGAVRPRSREEAAFTRLAIGVGALFLFQAGLIAAGESHRPLERYAIYLAPLVAVAFFAYVERGAPWRRVYAGLAIALGLAAWLVPFPSLADFRFSFDSPVLSAYGQLAHWLGDANAATVFAAVPLLASAAIALRPHAARTTAVIALALLVGIGVLAYAGDREMTQRTRATFAASPADWLDRGGYGTTDYLGLPGATPHFWWTLEAWNRDAGRPIWLDTPPPKNDSWAAGKGEIDPDGTLLVDGKPVAGGRLVVNQYASQIEIAGASTLVEPRPGLTLMDVPADAQVRSLAIGLYSDGLSTGNLHYRAWPAGHAGVYRVRLSLPEGLAARTVTATVGAAHRTVKLGPGASVVLELPARDAAEGLEVTTNRVELLDGGTANPRFVGFRVDGLEFVADPTASGVGL